MLTTNEIRRTFLDYFARNGHEQVPSSPLVPRNDPTLLFTNAGMVQFKNLFTGEEHRDYSRAVTSQKCVRAGGKHNDLENVGYTARHHTFFEMLGNFSFGDYFKDVAIEHAWTLVTREYGLARDRLLVTVYAEDDEAFDLWRKIAGLPESRILRIATSDNFWSMGDTGPCGPCSEIFYDHGPDVPGGPPGSADEDGDRFIEIWNLVFMQYEQKATGERVPLPSPSIDTGMGLERIAAVLQGKHDNYDIDLMRALVTSVAQATRTELDGPGRVSHRVIADHLRAISFLIADGVLPSNEGRGYVLRRIMRRAMRHAHMLGARDPVMYRLVPVLVEQMGQHFTELVRAEPLITEMLRLEEDRFRQTLDRGLRLLDDEVAQLGSGQSLPGDVAFKLYDTFGFPLDLTQDVLRGRGLSVDLDGFETAMARQRAEARKAWAGSGEMATERVWFDILDRCGPTEFLGYGDEVSDAEITAIVQGGSEVEQADAGQDVVVVTNQTPFYGESGGQVGDTGVIVARSGTRVMVSDTQRKAGGVFVHLGRVEEGSIRHGDAVEMRVNRDRRTAIRGNHSATHLLHAALRQRLGDHVTQKGSLVAPERLRFDISQPLPLSDEDVRAVEAQVNAEIRANTPVTTRVMPYDAALELGAMALFGEKYGDEVRVVSMGTQHPGANRPRSVELCGGTHVARTGEIGVFKIVSEGAVSAGIRRIEALTGAQALDYLDAQDRTVKSLAAQVRIAPSELESRLTGLLEDRRQLEREVSELRRKLAAAGTGSAGEGGASGVKTIQGVQVASRMLSDVPAKELKPLADELKRQMGSGIVVLVAVNEGKASAVVAVTDDLTDRFSAVDLVKVASEALGGKGGGGRPDMAQAGGPDGSAAQSAVKAVEDAVAIHAGS